MVTEEAQEQEVQDLVVEKVDEEKASVSKHK